MATKLKSVMREIIDGYCTPGTERDTNLSLEQLLRWMDAAGIARAVIAPEDREIALRNQTGNERILQLSKIAPDRLIPACTANPWLGQEGCDLLTRTVEAGAKILVLAPAVQGFYLSDELTDDLLHTAAGLRVPVYVHTGPHSASTPSQLLLLADRHPQTRFILGHCGSTDYTHDMPAVFGAAPKNVWFELSFVRPWALPTYAAMTDESRLIFGTSAPRNDPIFEMQQFNEHWPIDAHPGTYGGNLAALLLGVAHAR